MQEHTWPFSIIHHGATAGVTGSCHEFRMGTAGVLIDCGLFQGAEVSGGDTGATAIDFPIDHIEALILTHCHLDHVGRLPHLLAAGYDGPIYCSAATAALLPLLLEDALAIGFTRDRSLINRVVDLVRSRTTPVEYGVWRTPSGTLPQLQFKLEPAGHILGSAYIQLRLGRGKARTDVLFSGDLGAPHTPLLPAPKSPYGSDLLVLESTYGDRLHEGRRQRRDRLKTIIEHCLADRGVVLIPAFSIGRTQELLYELEQIIHQHGDSFAAPSKRWRDLEVVVDSPLAARFTTQYRQLRRHWDLEAKRRVRGGRHPLAFEQVTTIDDHATHLATVEYLRKTGRPTIVVAGSGMCNGGRIVNYLKALLPDPRTDVVFVGYQAEGTPGRIIQRYGPTQGYVELEGRRYTINAGVHTITGYSAHADQRDLLNFIARMRRRPREIRLVHGDDAAKRALGRRIAELFPAIRVTIPSSTRSNQTHVLRQQKNGTG